MVWDAVFTVTLHVLKWLIERVSTSKAQKKNFLDFVTAIQLTHLASANLNEADKKQLETLKKKKEALLKK